MTRNLADVLQVQRRKALSFPVSFPGSDPGKGIIPYIKLLFCPNGQPATGYQRKKEAKKEAARATLPLRRDGDPFSRSLALAENTTYKTPLQLSAAANLPRGRGESYNYSSPATYFFISGERGLIAVMTARLPLGMVTDALTSFPMRILPSGELKLMIFFSGSKSRTPKML